MPNRLVCKMEEFREVNSLTHYVSVKKWDTLVMVKDISYLTMFFMAANKRGIMLHKTISYLKDRIGARDFFIAQVLSK